MRFFFASLFLLVIGFVRGELGSFIWGGLFFFLIVYFWMGAFMVRFAFRRLVRKELLISFKPPLPESHSKIELSFSTLALPLILPGLFGVLRLRAQHSSQRCLQWRWRLSSFCNPQFIIRAPRGCYSLYATYEIRDIFGLSCIECPVETNEILTVVPSLATVALTDNIDQKTEGETQLKQRASSMELLDVRKYFPGDDVKRLHWGLFAHAREPFLRIGDEAPKQEQRQLFVVDTSTVCELDEDALDLRLAQLHAYLQKQQKPWLCLFSQKGLKAVGNEDLKQWVQTAAKLHAKDPDIDAVLAQMPLTGAAGCSVAVVSSQGCSGTTKLTEVLLQHGFSPYTLFFHAKENPKKQRRPWWMRQDRGTLDRSHS